MYIVLIEQCKPDNNRQKEIIGLFCSYLDKGYTYEELLSKKTSNPKLEYVLDNIDCLIDGPFMQEEKDITLQMRGSRNQRIIYLTRK